MTKEQILDALDRFIAQRPGLEPGNYISGWHDIAGRKAYRAESRQITRDRHDAERLLGAVSRAFALDVETLRGAFRAYSGRLTLSETPEGGARLDYCTGQYFPTEYRRAVCAVLAQALWDHYREDYAASARKGESAGDAIRRNFRREYGARFARRWFDA
jgi:hypothetical protein